MTASKAKQATTSTRRAEMLRMKNAGSPVAEIAAHFGVSRNTASKDLTRAIRKAKALEVQEADLWRQLQAQRLETLLAAVWPEAITGAVKEVEQARKLIADLTELLGVRVPVRTEISGPDGGAIPFSGNELSELEALIDFSARDETATLGRLEPDEEESDLTDGDGNKNG
ncbi:helix-turn-helix domain-containing protein [Streptomyces sp. NPDC059076]|uniref:helix-turn-helix domain-containing protein n=1 Tax=unclassified Streptomyces TaxID=2593676 RepID=UPI003681AA59